MGFEQELIARARQNKQRIVLAEGEEERILRATNELLKQELADAYAERYAMLKQLNDLPYPEA